MTKGQEKNLRRVVEACKAIRMSDGEIPPTVASITTLSGVSKATLYRSPYKEVVADLTAECPRPATQPPTADSSKPNSVTKSHARDGALIELLQAEVLRLTMLCERQAGELAARPGMSRGTQVVRLTDTT